LSAIERLRANSERAKVNAWLDRINETDEACRAEVLESGAPKTRKPVHIT